MPSTSNRKDAKQTESHDSTSALYVDAGHRTCVGCPEDANIHRLKRFMDAGNNQFSVLCRDCLAQEEKFCRKDLDDTAVKVVSELTTTLKDMTRQRGDSLPLERVMAELHRPLTRQRKNNRVATAFERTGRVFNKVISKALKQDATDKQVELAVDVGKCLIKTAIDVDRRVGSPIDPELSDEQARELLMEPARQLIINDSRFRKMLINDPEIRRLLMAEMGMDLIDEEPAKVQ